ncbi:hypothetical protein PQS31_01610 [Luteimonas sp BLCC-B24]|uniref:hypothetical protein n=1 Tax=Luteimonas sp. BLCC-B24 TaxID=3025317 RepID=UPI00234DF7EC|nr:hypothetical protein [Luteimonas sp. BLCC-B24]MDC7805527.1 hypothetical protein [Luteimonas sp. BLCC-B24]
MASKFTRSQGTRLFISTAVTDALTTPPIDDEDYIALGCTLNSYNRAGGQRTEIDVSTFCSEVMEKDFGLKDNGTATFSGNYFDGDEAQDLLREAEATGDRHEFRVIDARNREARFIGVVTQTSEESSVNGKWNATFTVAIVSPIVRAAYVP